MPEIALKDFGIAGEELLASFCRKYFHEFVRELWEEVPGSGKMIWNWHMETICNELQTVAERVFAGLPKEYDLVINCPPGTSKPVWEEMPVLLGNGRYVSLKNVVVGDFVIGKSGNPCRVKAVHVQGNLPCIRIETINGRELVVARDHPILTADGWKKAEEIRPHQMLALMHKPRINAVRSRKDEEFVLAGYLIGDGSVSHSNCNVTNADPDYIEDLRSCLDKLDNFGCNVTRAKNKVVVIRLKNKDGKRKSYGPRKWMKEIGLTGRTSKTKIVPKFVWNGADEQVALFLASYFHCDGTVCWRDKGKRNITVSMCTISKSLAIGLQRLFLRLGICMRFRRHVTPGGFSYNRDLKDYVTYRVETTDQDAASRFMEKIPLKGRKANKMVEFFPRRKTFEQKFWPDRVISVEDTKESLPCRCLEVEKDESFTVNGVVVHNSSLVSILFPAWCWTRKPQTRIITASHTETLTLDLANKARYVILSDKFKSFYPEIAIRDDQSSKGYYANSLGGDRYTCTVAGKSPTGMHCHFAITDDPIDPKKAVSEAELKAAQYFYDAVLPGRKVNKEVSVEILIAQRLHEEDPAGYLLARAKREGTAKIRHICLPAELAENVSPPELRRNYTDGLLDPVRLPRSVLRRELATMGAYAFAGQYAQSPVPLGGGVFHVEYFNQRCKAAPYHARRVRFWDRACLVAGTKISTSTGLRDIEKINVGDLVLTRAGYKRVKWAGLTKFVNELVSVQFANGSVVTGTADHKVWAENRGWVALASVNSGDYNLCITKGGDAWRKNGNEDWTRKRLNLMEFSTQDGRVRGISRQCERAGTVNTGRIPFIGRSGDFITVTSPKSTTFTTKMEIGITTTSKISNASPVPNTTGFMVPSPNGTKSGKQTRNIMKERVYDVPTSFIPAARSSNITQDFAVGDAGLTESRWSVLFVTNHFGEGQIPGAARKSVLPYFGSSNASFATKSSTATKRSTKSIAVLNVVPSIEKIPVYDLEVEEDHEFFANGILVHNSSTSGSGSRTAGVLMAKDAQGNFYVENVVVGRWEPDLRNAKMRAAALRDRSRYGPSNEPVIYVEAEGGSSGRDAWKGVARALAGFDVREQRVTGRKQTRAEPWAAQLASKNVWMVADGTWDINEYIQEHILFPNGKWNDLIDSSSGAFNILVGPAHPGSLRVLPFRDLQNRKKPSLRIIVCSEEDIGEMENRFCLLVSVAGKTGEAKGGFLDSLSLIFDDLEPEQFQDSWDKPVDGKLPAELVMKESDGKKLWAFLLKRRDPPAGAIVFQGNKGDRRALSLAYAVADQMRLPREKTIECLGMEGKIEDKGKPPNWHVFEMAKRGRSLIVS